MQNALMIRIDTHCVKVNYVSMDICACRHNLKPGRVKNLLLKLSCVALGRLRHAAPVAVSFLDWTVRRNDGSKFRAASIPRNGIYLHVVSLVTNFLAHEPVEVLESLIVIFSVHSHKEVVNVVISWHKV